MKCLRPGRPIAYWAAVGCISAGLIDLVTVRTSCGVFGFDYVLLFLPVSLLTYGIGSVVVGLAASALLHKVTKLDPRRLNTLILIVLPIVLTLVVLVLSTRVVPSPCAF
jgi:hypothetical protein